MNGFQFPTWVISVAVSILLFSIGLVMGRKKVVKLIRGDSSVEVDDV